MFQSITLFDFKLERLSTGAWNWILERIEWKELSFAFDHQLYCVASFCVLIERKYHVHHLGKISNTSHREGMIRHGYIIFNPMYQNQNIRSLNLSHWKSLARNPTWYIEVVKHPDVCSPTWLWRCPKWKYGNISVELGAPPLGLVSLGSRIIQGIPLDWTNVNCK